MRRTRLAGALSLALILAALTPVAAEQSTTVTPTSGPKTMAEYATAVNQALLAILSCNSGNTAPTNGVGNLATHYQCWADTSASPVVIKIYDGAQWVSAAKLDATAHLWTPVYRGTDLGTASTATLGASGHTIPFLDAANVWSGPQSFESGDFLLKGSTSGTVTISPPAVAGSNVITVPAATDTLVGKATTDTFTNKTFDTAGAGNSFSINGLAATANTGTGSVVRQTSPTINSASLASPSMTTPVLGVAAATSLALNGATIGSSALAVSGLSQFGGQTIITANSASALAVGVGGATNPQFQVDASNGSFVTGIRVFGSTLGGGAGLTVLSSGANEALSVNAKGTGGIQIGNSSTGNVSITPPLSVTNNTTVQSNSALALAVGTGGQGNPAFQVDSSTASQATGVKVTGLAAGSGAGIAAISSATNENIAINSKGSGQISIGNASSGPVVIGGGGGATTISSGLSVTGSFTAAGLVDFTDIASTSLATAAQYIAGAANVVVPASVVYQAETTTTFGATTTFDFNTFINTAVTLTGNITTMTLSNVKAGQSGMITFIQDGTGGRTTVWNSIFKFSGGTLPTLTSTAGAVDVLSYSCRSATFCVASLVSNVK